MPLVGTVELHAYGLGLMLYSPSVESRLKAGGYHTVTALWTPSKADPMTIHLFLKKATKRVAGGGWPYLAYRVRADG